jgi:hypothetical protein
MKFRIRWWKNKVIQSLFKKEDIGSNACGDNGLSIPQIIKFTGEPLNLETTQILYLEDKYHPSINNYFEKNIENFSRIFGSKNYRFTNFEFVYIPRIINNLALYFPNFKEKSLLLLRLF